MYLFDYINASLFGIINWITSGSFLIGLGTFFIMMLVAGFFNIAENTKVIAEIMKKERD